MLHLYHYNDPDAPQTPHYWDFVYLHGQAEDDNHERMLHNEWEWAAPDIFLADQPMPEGEGDYEGELYGRKVILVLRKPFGRNWISGRVAYADDKTALRHAQTPEDWR